MANRDELLPAGKLPGELLGSLLGHYISPDPAVLIGPGIGRDAAAIQVDETALVVKTDPITFSTNDAGRYLVNVNANDITCMGASPRWLLVTALFPDGKTTPAMVEDTFASLATAASEIGVALVGGHTEITIGLDRLILVGQMIGTCAPSDLYDLSRAEPGDAVLLASGIAIEGTSILAHEAHDELVDRIDAELLASAERFLESPGISVIPAARALQNAGVAIRGLHDPTEGGLATALGELAAAASLGIEVDGDAIPIRDETRAICSALGIDPLGLIASGALLAVVDGADADRGIAALNSAGIPAGIIGHIIADGSCSMVRDGRRQPLPVFAVDEIARFFAERESAQSNENRP
ncbi:MAG: AIR synthase-related protein [Thermomicrobiales bacterium]|nr:AIR synthase-related protein [Thermomicrobiales bacterium]